MLDDELFGEVRQVLGLAPHETLPSDYSEMKNASKRLGAAQCSTFRWTNTLSELPAKSAGVWVCSKALRSFFPVGDAHQP